MLQAAGRSLHRGRQGTTRSSVSLDQFPPLILLRHAQELQEEEEEETSAQARAVGRAGMQLGDGAARSHTALMSDASVSTAGHLPCPLTAALMQIGPEP